MFESIVIRSAVANPVEAIIGKSFDRGVLAEAIMFYGEVHLIFNRAILSGIVTDIGIGNLLRMLRAHYVRGSYVRDQPIIYTQGSLHTSSQARQAGEAGKPGAKFDLEDELTLVLERAGEKRKVAKSAARQLLGLLPVTQLNDGSPAGPDFASEFASDMRRQKDYLPQAKMILDSFLPEVESTRLSRFKVLEEKANQFVVDTDLDWNAVKTDSTRLYDGKLQITPAQVLAQIQGGFIDLGIVGQNRARMAAKYVHRGRPSHISQFH